MKKESYGEKLLDLNTMNDSNISKRNKKVLKIVENSNKT